MAPECAPYRRYALSWLPEDVLRDVYHHARQTYPEECCGMILETGVRRCRNAQGDLHRVDPVAFPRTAAEAFCFDATDQLFLAESIDAVEPVRAIYHSHADGTADFSDLDRAGALFDGVPIYPRLLHLVVDGRRDHIHGARLYAHVDGNLHEVARFAGARL